MWECKIRVYWIDISSYMCHPVTKPSSSAHFESLLSLLLLCPMSSLTLSPPPHEFLLTSVFLNEEIIRKVSWDIIISMLLGYGLDIWARAWHWLLPSPSAKISSVLTCTLCLFGAYSDNFTFSMSSFFKLSEESCSHLCIVHACSVLSFSWFRMLSWPFLDTVQGSLFL
jgi:hypothetical protein